MRIFLHNGHANYLLVINTADGQGPDREQGVHHNEDASRHRECLPWQEYLCHGLNLLKFILRIVCCPTTHTQFHKRWIQRVAIHLDSLFLRVIWIIEFIINWYMDIPLAHLISKWVTMTTREHSQYLNHRNILICFLRILFCNESPYCIGIN